MAREIISPASAAPLSRRLDETAEALNRQGLVSADVGVILGTGLGSGMQEALSDCRRLSYAKVPHLQLSKLEGHAGNLVWGRLGGQEVVSFHGRFHCYEGYTAAQVAYPVRILQRLGAKSVIVTNIAGGINPAFKVGDFMLVTDHINLMGVNPLIGPNDETLGPRFPDMCAPYSQELIALAKSVARAEGISLCEGVYAGVIGPNLETKAEYRLLRMIGADAVGMSTVPEVIVAIHAGMRVLGISLISDLCIPETLEPVDLPKLLKVAAAGDPVLARLLRGILERVPTAACLRQGE